MPMLSQMTQKDWPEASDEIQVRQLIDRLLEAIQRKDVDAILSLHTSEAIIYEIIDALWYGKEGLRKAWEDHFKKMRVFDLEIQDPTIEVGEKLAFSYWLAHAKGISHTGEKMDFWARHTMCYKNLNGKWAIVHSHISVPGDYTKGTIMTHLKP